MRIEIEDPLRDKVKYSLLLPIAQHIYDLHENGQNYDAFLQEASRITGQIVDKPTVLYAFGVGGPEYFTRSLLTDWDSLPIDLNKNEMLELIEAVCAASGTQDRCEYWLKCLAINTGDAAISDLIYWPDQYQDGRFKDQDLSSQEMLKIALQSGGRHDL